MSCEFIKSAIELSGCPELGLPEVGIVGRSNSGKSSIINALAKRKKMARVSQTPGKTTLLNFYKMDRHYVLVDMPGYGYASRSHSERDAWTPMIESYLQSRECLRGVVLIMDVQRPWSDDENHLIDWLSRVGVPVILVFNKIDKLNQKEMAAKQKEFSKIFSKFKAEPGIIYTSAEKNMGVEDLSRAIFNNFLKTGERKL